METVDNRTLAGLQVTLIAGWQRQQLFDLGARGGDTGIACPHQLNDIRIALVRHDRTAGRVLRGQIDEAEFGRREQGKIPGKATQIEHRRAKRIECGHLKFAA